MGRRLPLLDRRLRWLVVALVAGGILLASVVRPDGVGEAVGPFGILGLDKWFHLLGYALLALALAYALVEWNATWGAIGAVGGAVAFGFGVELLQATIPYRGFSWLDLVANALGPLVVGTLWPHLLERVRFQPWPTVHRS